MTRTRYTMPARPQGKLAEKDVHRGVCVYNMAPNAPLVRKWLTTRLDNFYCDLQIMYIVLNNTPPLPSVARTDEAVEVDAYGGPRDAVKALIKATWMA